MSVVSQDSQAAMLLSSIKKDTQIIIQDRLKEEKRLCVMKSELANKWAELHELEMQITFEKKHNILKAWIVSEQDNMSNLFLFAKENEKALGKSKDEVLMLESAFDQLNEAQGKVIDQLERHKNGLQQRLKDLQIEEAKLQLEIENGEASETLKECQLEELKRQTSSFHAYKIEKTHISVEKERKEKELSDAAQEVNKKVGLLAKEFERIARE